MKNKSIKSLAGILAAPSLLLSCATAPIDIPRNDYKIEIDGSEYIKLRSVCYNLKKGTICYHDVNSDCSGYDLENDTTGCVDATTINEGILTRYAPWTEEFIRQVPAFIIVGAEQEYTAEEQKRADKYFINHFRSNNNPEIEI